MRRRAVRLIVFAKAPAGGRVKTRLARGIGMAAATAWYRKSLLRTLTMLRRAGIECEIAAAPSAPVFRAASNISGRIATQAMGDLGRRMAMAARMARGPCAIVGADIPGLSASIVRSAREAVKRCDLVLGPARDGGFYLVGVKSPAHVFRLYDRVRWSSEHAMADTLANAPKHWRIAFLPPLDDVDVAADLKLAAQPPASAFVRTTVSPART